jgi:hypothetical protein
MAALLRHDANIEPTLIKGIAGTSVLQAVYVAAQRLGIKGNVSMHIPKPGSDADPSAAASSPFEAAPEPAEAHMLRLPPLGPPLPPGAQDNQAFILHFNADRVRACAHAVPKSLLCAVTTGEGHATCYGCFVFCQLQTLPNR